MKTKKLSKGVVTLRDGRYLIYYGWDKSKYEVKEEYKITRKQEYKIK